MFSFKDDSLLSLAAISNYVNFVTDLRDRGSYEGLSENIFVGKVISQHVLKVWENIRKLSLKSKGCKTSKKDLSGTVLVYQLGGYNEDEVILVDKDSLLQPGKTYLFAMRYLRQENLHTVIPHYADIVLDSITKQIVQLKKAVQQQIPFQLIPTVKRQWMSSISFLSFILVNLI